MAYFGRFYLDKEKDMIVDLDMNNEELSFCLYTPNHHTGNLITNLAKLCSLPLSQDEHGLKIIRGKVPCYYDAYNQRIYIFRLGGTKTANIYPDGRIEMKAHVPAISKTLMSQTKDYKLDIERTIIKTYIKKECKFRTDLHTHMNANLEPDVLIALGIAHQIQYPLYYIKKLQLQVNPKQQAMLDQQRRQVSEEYIHSGLTGKYLDRRIDDHTFINFADFILRDPEIAAYNIPRIRASLAVLKDGQAVFTNLEKVYLYRYVFTKAQSHYNSNDRLDPDRVPDLEIARTLRQILRDRENPVYQNNTLFQDKLLWIARAYQSKGIRYVEISDTNLVKKETAPGILQQIHEVMPSIYEETGVRIRFLAAIRRIPLTIIKDSVTPEDYLYENMRILHAVASDPYVAGSDIVGEEINDIREMKPVLREIVRISSDVPGFVVRIHAGENDSLRDNVANSIHCVKESLEPGQKMPMLRIGHGLYTCNLKSKKGQQLIQDILDQNAILEFQITSNVRLNNLSGDMTWHPLKTYLHAGIGCVQGTDGGALYGTDSIDEQLSLEKLLKLSEEDLRSICHTEERILSESEKAFALKTEAFKNQRKNLRVEDFIRQRIQEPYVLDHCMMNHDSKRSAAEALSDRIEELPTRGLPVTIAGGSFYNDQRHRTVREEDRKLIDQLLSRLDPEKSFFIIGHKLKCQEEYLVSQNKGRFRIYAFVPSMISDREERRLREAGVRIRVSIESSSMGLYKSIAYEVFKRRTSVLVAFDGNSAAANLIQEAKNSQYSCWILISRHSRVLRQKAGSLEGYVTIFGSAEEAVQDIIKKEGQLPWES